MPEPIPFPESNLTLTAPPGMDDCMELPVWSGAVPPNGRPYVISKWRLTQAEIDQVARTGHIWLWVCSAGTSPPVSIGTDNPFHAVEVPDDSLRVSKPGASAPLRVPKPVPSVDTDSEGAD